MSCKHLSALICMGVFWSSFTTVATGSGAPGTPRVQILTENLEPHESHLYDVPNLKRGETLYVYLERMSGALDPVMAIADAAFDYNDFEEYVKAKTSEAVETGRETVDFLAEAVERFFFALDDDGGKGYAAALKFPIPADGDYKLLVAGARHQFGESRGVRSFGGYRLSVGVNAPEILTGKATSTGEEVASPSFPFRRPVQEITGTVTWFTVTDVPNEN